MCHIDDHLVLKYQPSAAFIYIFYTQILMRIMWMLDVMTYSTLMTDVLIPNETQCESPEKNINIKPLHLG